MDDKLKEAVSVLVEALKTDESYRIGWQANIAMTFKDEFWRTCRTRQHLDLMDEESLHEIANKASNNFLNLLCRDGGKN